MSSSTIEGAASSRPIHDNDQDHPVGDPRALFLLRVLAAAALTVTAALHARVALQDGLGGPLLSRGHLLLADAFVVGLLGLALLGRDNRLWVAAVLLSTAGLVAIFASVYLDPPTIDEPVWLLSKAVCALTQLTVIALWLIRRIAPPSPRRPA